MDRHGQPRRPDLPDPDPAGIGTAHRIRAQAQRRAHARLPRSPTPRRGRSGRLGRRRGAAAAGRRRLLPATASAEAGYLIDRLGGPEHEAGLVAGVAVGAFEPVDLRPVIRVHVTPGWLALLLIRITENATETTWDQIKPIAQRLYVVTYAGPDGTVGT